MIVLDTNRDVTPYLPAMRGKVSTVIRYINPLGTASAKTVHPAEAHAIANAGMSLFCVCEGYGDVTHGAINSSMGAHDELVCVTYAKQIGMPLDDVGLAFAIDFDIQPAQIRAYALPYFAAIHAKMPKGVDVMVYGNGAVIEAVIAAGYAVDGWASCSGAWLGTHAYLGTNRQTLRQHVPSKPFGFDCDVNDVNPAKKLKSFVPFSSHPSMPDLAPLVFPDTPAAAAPPSLWTSLRNAIGV